VKIFQDIFGKEPSVFGFADLQNFFLKDRFENEYLEFKSGEIKLNSLFREVAAFANSKGGILIVGAPLESKMEGEFGREIRFCKGSLTWSEIKSAAYIREKLSENIQPNITDIEILEFLNPMGNQFVIIVSPSINPPHMCVNDGRYYIRAEDMIKPAPHNIVKELLFKNQKTFLETDIEITRPDSCSENQDVLQLIFRNKSHITAKEFCFKIELFNIEEVNNDDQFVKGPDCKYSLELNKEYPLLENQPLQEEFSFRHKFQPYLICLSACADNAEGVVNYLLWDPSNFRTINFYKTGDVVEKSKESFIDLLKDLINNL